MISAENDGIHYLTAYFRQVSLNYSRPNTTILLTSDAKINIDSSMGYKDWLFVALIGLSKRVLALQY